MKWLNLFLFAFGSFSAFAQYDEEPDVASRHRPGIMWYFTGLKPDGRNSAPKYDRLMIDLNYNTWTSDSKIFSAKPTSIGFALHGMFDIPLAPKNTIGLGIGLSFRVQRIRFDGQLRRVDSTQSTLLDVSSATQEMTDRSLFGTNSFAIPVELRLRTPGWKHVKVHVGMNVGVRTRMFTKTTISGDFSRNHGFHDANRFFYGVHARFGFRNWSLFADYTLNRQFKSEQSTQLQPLRLGITCSLF